MDRGVIAALRREYGTKGMISFALTLEQCRARTKTETRRTGWRTARAGMRLLGVSKVMGFRKGESIEDVAELLGVIELVEVHREPLHAITPSGCIAEGFPDLDPPAFVAMFLGHARGMLPRDEVTVLRFRWLT